MKTSIMLLLCLLFSDINICQSPRYQKIAAAEYFINTDPGEGNGIPITVNAQLWEIDLNVNNINCLPNSVIYVRAKSTNGKWSAPRSIIRKEYFTNRNASIVYGEVYINNDPGYRNGSPITFQDGEVLIRNLKIKRGDKIFVRVLDSNNNWSPSKEVTFRFKNLIKAEYRIKLSNGGTTTPENMLINPPNDSTSTFFAYKDNIPAKPDTAFEVRFQTEDKFYSNWVDIFHVNTIIYDDKANVTSFFLSNNYPNPFNPLTTIQYGIQSKQTVNLTVYDILGREIKNLVNEEKEAGSYEIKFNAASYSSGIYFYRIKAGTYTNTRKMILMK